MFGDIGNTLGGGLGGGVDGAQLVFGKEGKREIDMAEEMMGEPDLPLPVGLRLRAQADGQLVQTADVPALANYFNTLVSGLGVQAKGGATRDELRAVVDAAMGIWRAP